MYTKIFFLLSLFILSFAIIGFASKSNIDRKQSLKTENITVKPQDKENHQATDVVPFKMSETNSKENEHHKPNSEEDGKHYHFHFGRIRFNKRSYLLLIVAKIILFVSHISVMIFTFLHVFH